MNGVGIVGAYYSAMTSSPRAADQTAANAAHAAQSGAVAALSAARSCGDTGAIATAQQNLASASAAAVRADAWVRSDTGLNLVA